MIRCLCIAHGKRTLSWYAVMNGVRSNVATNDDIKFIDNNMFILETNFNTGFNLLDSLKR